MPVLSQEEFDNLNQQIVNLEDELKDKNYDLNEVKDKVGREKNQKTIFLVMSVVFFLLLVAATSVYFIQPDLLQLETPIASDEVVVKQAQIDDFESQIAALEAKVAEHAKSKHPLDDGEFYAVQLGAFKKFNMRLSSPSYTVINNANFEDFNLYTLGVFDTKEEAEKLREIVRRLSFRDAFVGYYKDGVRVEK